MASLREVLVVHSKSDGGRLETYKTQIPESLINSIDSHRYHLYTLSTYKEPLADTNNMQKIYGIKHTTSHSSGKVTLYSGTGGPSEEYLFISDHRAVHGEDSRYAKYRGLKSQYVLEPVRGNVGIDKINIYVETTHV